MSVDFEPIYAFSLPSVTLAEQKSLSTIYINDLARAKILSVYPEWKQANLTVRAIELQSLNQVGSSDWLAIQAVWEWVKMIRIESNVANAAIAESVSSEEVATIEQGFRSYVDALI